MPHAEPIPPRVVTFVDLQRSFRAMSSSSGTMSMMALWLSSWASHGWEPHILTSEALQKDRDYASLMPRIRRAAERVVEPMTHGNRNLTLTEREQQIRFRARGVIQFYAASVAGGGALADSDVMNYGLTPADVVAASGRVAANGHGGKILLLDGRKCCCRSPRETNPWCATLTPAEFVGSNCTRIHSMHDLVPLPPFVGGAPDARASSQVDALDAPMRAAVATCPQVSCVAPNNGLTAGGADEYRRFVHDWVENILAVDDMRQVPKPWRIFEEMHVVTGQPPFNAWADKHVTRHYMAMSYSPFLERPLRKGGSFLTLAWRRVKAIHFWGSGVCAWLRALCAAPIPRAKCASKPTKHCVGGLHREAEKRFLLTGNVKEAQRQLCLGRVPRVSCGKARAAIIQHVRPLATADAAVLRERAACCARLALAEREACAILARAAELATDAMTDALLNATRSGPQPADLGSPSVAARLAAMAGAARACWVVRNATPRHAHAMRTLQS